MLITAKMFLLYKIGQAWMMVGTIQNSIFKALADA